ncbi:glycosyltransferase family 9 protein [Bordetella sp. 2513F-2]
MMPWPADAPRRVAVFRALQLGDMLCAVPALRALRRAWPHAHVTLIGLGDGGEFRRRYARYIDDWMSFPGLSAFPEQPPDEAALPAFYAQARARRFDLALQMHGSGAQSNAVVRELGARRWAGFVPDPAMAQAGRFLPWPDDLPEPLRYLALLRHLGIGDAGTQLELPLQAADHEAASQLFLAAGLEPARTIVVHPGARLASRRWPAERFGAVAASLLRDGWQVALTGTSDEAPIRRQVLEGGAAGATDLGGRTTLGSLAALLSRCRLAVCNDTGISHVCAAVGAPSVVVASGSDVRRWAPLDARRHTVLWADAPCRPCSHDVCPVGHRCALDVPAQRVLATIRERLEEVA